ncbi:MAG: hypothetical protein CM1200mP30_23700 [Pseudomonadota bacterium]|nr:MAG: hypothetical protein CM1200mP30_23700 [Pseudomonadota bacterium]
MASLTGGKWNFKLYKKPADLEQRIIDPVWKESGWGASRSRGIG